MSLWLPYNGLVQYNFNYVWRLIYTSKFWIIHIFETFISSIEIFFTYFSIKFVFKMKFSKNFTIKMEKMNFIL